MKLPTHSIFVKIDSAYLIDSAKKYLDSGIKCIYCDRLDAIHTLRERFPRTTLMTDYISQKCLSPHIDFVRLEAKDCVQDCVQKSLQSHNITPIMWITTQDDIDIARRYSIKSLCINDKNIENIEFGAISDDTTIMLDSNIDSTNNAFVAFSRCDSIMIDNVNLNGKLLYKLTNIRKQSRFYRALFDNKELKILVGKLTIDDVCNLSNIDALGFVLDSTNEIQGKKNLFRFLSKFRPNLLKIGIINDKEILHIARDFIDCGILDALKINNADRFKLENANFAFFSDELDDRFLQSHLKNRLIFITK